LMRRQVEDIKFWLQRGAFTSTITNTHILEKISKISSFQAYFPKEILQKYNETALIFTQIAEVYFEAGKTGNLAQKNAENLSMFLKEFSKQSNVLVREVLEELERNKSLIV